MELLERALPYDEHGELQPRVVSMAADAKAVWEGFHNCIEQDSAPKGELSQITGLAAKCAEQAARIGLVLALIDSIDTVEVSQRHIAAGIKLAQFYLSEGLRLYDAGQIDAALEKAATLLQWLQSHEAQHWDVRDLYRNGPRVIRSKAAAMEALQILEHHGWVKQAKGQWEVVRELS